MRQVARGKALPPEVVEQIVAKTDGVPLFVEELTKMVLESGLLAERDDGYVLASPLPPLAIPATLHDSLRARLDRLGPVKALAQLAATLGRAFSYDLLQAVSLGDEATLQRGLHQLVEAELLYQQGSLPQATYVFKHALIQDAAYESLLKRTRQQYHQRIVQVLAERFPTMAAAEPELLAHHYTEAGLLEQAVPYWLRAGERAVERSANIEAINHFTKGLAVLERLPTTPEHLQQALTLYLALGSPLAMVKGHTAPEVERVYAQAQALCQQLGESHQRFEALLGLWMFTLNRAHLRMAHDLAGQSCTLAQRLDDATCMQEAHVVLGTTCFYLGDFVAARGHLEQRLALSPSQGHRVRAFNRVRNPKITCLVHTSVTLWTLGFPEQAFARSQEALALARESSHAYDLGFALHFAALLHHHRREANIVYGLAEAAATLAREHGFVRWLGGSLFWRGWALAEKGAADEGITHIRQGLAIWHAMGGELGLPRILAMLAEAYSNAGDVAAGLQVLTEALATAYKNAECRDIAELYRLTGELSIQRCAHADGREPADRLREAEEHLHQAIVLSRQQQAKSFELRAVMSLSRLWQRQGKRAEAYHMLAQIYSWFTEGFDTPDLQKAQALLEAWQ